MRRPRALVVVIALTAAGACASLGVHGRTGGSQIGIGQTAPGPLRPPAGESHQSRVATQRVCRTGSWPKGWIAIAYSESTNECAGGTAERHGYDVAVITRYDNLPVMTTLEVCADQAVPSGWAIDGDDQAGEGCPGSRPGGASATRVIRRVQ